VRPKRIRYSAFASWNLPVSESSEVVSSDQTPVGSRRSSPSMTAMLFGFGTLPCTGMPSSRSTAAPAPVR
jgi:hypothetical protein